METRKHALEEKLNIRCFYLRLLRRSWLLPLAALAGALAGFLLYTAVTHFTRPALYEARARLYIHYIENASDDRVYDYYNAYTWSDIVMTEPIARLTEEKSVREAADTSFLAAYETNAEDASARLWQAADSGAQVTVYGEIPSDLRILHLVARSESEHLAAYRLRTYVYALVRFAELNEAFRSMEVLDISDAAPVTYPDRQAVAAACGAVAGLLLALFLLFAGHCLDDAVYVPEDASRRYGLPVQAVLPKASEVQSQLPLLKEECRVNLLRLAEKGKKWQLLQTQDMVLTDDMESLLPGCGVVLKEAGVTIKVVSSTESVNDADVLLLRVRAGAKNGTLYEHLTAQCEACGRRPDGIILTDTDNRFLAKYYRIAQNGSKEG